MLTDAKGYDWKHATQIRPLSKDQVTHTAVFDDEGAGEVVLYRTDGARFSPCRSVSTEDREHFDSVLEAWGNEFPLLDRRNDRTIPLPATTAA
jgi:hypothetical protein